MSKFECQRIWKQYFETWNDFLRADMTRKETLKQKTSFDNYS